MYVVAGPPGSGKSTVFPVSSFGVAHFNADDRAAQLNGGSYIGISAAVRAEVNREYESFVTGSIGRGESFAIETTLRSTVTFEQARMARDAGFTVEMRYLALATFGMHLERVKARADAGGHSASESTLRRIFDASLSHLSLAVVESDRLWVYDNSPVGGPPRLVMKALCGRVVFLADSLPGWVPRVGSGPAPST